MKSIVIALGALLVAGSLHAQPGTRKTEASISFSLQNISAEGGESQTNVLIAPRVGFFVYRGLELEPELILLKPQRGDVMYVLNGNLTYNFFEAGNTVPFVLAGFGVSNSVPLFQLPLNRYDFTVTVVNLGAGVKAFVADNVAARVEYRFQKFSGEKAVSFGGYGYTSKVDVKLNTLQVGFSVFF